MIAATARPIYKRVWDFLGSRDLSVFIFVMGMTYFLILTILGTVATLPGVTNISKLLPYKVLYILFFINLLICEIKWIPVVIRRCRKPRPPDTGSDMERFSDRIEMQNSGCGMQNIERYLRRRGYKVKSGVSSQESVVSGDNDISRSTSRISPFLYAYKGRFSTLGNLLFHISFLFFLAGIGLGIFYRFSGTLVLAEGQGTMGGDTSEYLSWSASEFIRPPRISFEVNKIIPVFWMGKLLFKDLYAEVTHQGGRGIMRIGQPISIDGARVNITGIGITPKYVLKNNEGRVLDSAYVNMKIVVPGAEDTFKIYKSPYRVRVSFYPDFEQREGRGYSRSMNPVNPVYEVRVLRNKDNVFKGFIRSGEEARFDGLRLSFPEFGYSGTFGVVYDMGFPFIWIGMVFMVLGIIWRLIFYRKEILVWQGGDGVCWISGRSDYYRRLFVSELEHLRSIAV